MSFNDVSIISVIKNDYRTHFWYTSEDEATKKWCIIKHKNLLSHKNG